MTKLTQDEQELYKILNDFRQSSIIISAKGSVLGVDEDVRAFKQSIADAEQAILALKERWQLEARMEELDTVPLDVRDYPELVRYRIDRRARLLTKVRHLNTSSNKDKEGDGPSQ